MYRFAAPFVGLAAFLASPAHAQLADPPPPLPSDPSRGALAVESGASWLGWGNGNVGVGTDCASLSFQLKGLDAEAAAAERLSKGFGKIGDGLTLLAAGSQAYQGRYDDMTQTLGEAAFDKSVCAIWPGPVCVSWSAGRMAGATIKMMPMPFDSKHRTIEEAVMDGEVRFAQWLMPSLNQPMNVQNMQAAFAEFQRKRAALLNARDRARSAAGQCKMSDGRAGADEADGAAGQRSNGDRAMSRFNDLAPAYIPSGSNDSRDGQYGGQTSAPAYSPPPVQQSQGSSNSGAMIGQALGAVLQGYVAGRANGANQSSTTSKPSTAPQPSQEQCSNSALPEGMVCTAN
jgi:hypothetical protein